MSGTEEDDNMEKLLDVELVVENEGDTGSEDDIANEVDNSEASAAYDEEE